MSLFHPNDSESDLMGYVYACYFTYSHNVTMVYHKQDVCSHVVAQWLHDVYETNHSSNIV